MSLWDLLCFYTFQINWADLRNGSSMVKGAEHSGSLQTLTLSIVFSRPIKISKNFARDYNYLSPCTQVITGTKAPVNKWSSILFFYCVCKFRAENRSCAISLHVLSHMFLCSCMCSRECGLGKAEQSNHVSDSVLPSMAKVCSVSKALLGQWKHSAPSECRQILHCLSHGHFCRPLQHSERYGIFNN